MASARMAEMLARYGHAYDVIRDDPVGGREAMASLCAQLSKLSPRELDADGAKLRKLRNAASRDVLEAMSVAGAYQEALEWLEAFGWSAGNPDDEIGLERKAYLLHQLGQSKAAGELIVALLDRATEPSYLSLPPLFCALPRYGLFEMAHAWIASRRDLATAPAGWLTPLGRQLLYNLEAQLLVEEGLVERALVAYDKAASADKSNSRHVGGLEQDLVIMGRPGLALRLLSKVSKPLEEEVLWKALALRAEGRTDEAAAVLNGVADANMPGDEFLILHWVLVHAYLHRVADADVCAKLEEYAADGVEFDDVIYYALGLAYALEGRLDEAQVALQRAVNETRRRFTGAHLDRERWYHCTQLLSPATQEVLRPYFDPKLMPERVL